MQDQNAPLTADDVELLSFRIRDQEYCVDITSVREIRGWTQATPLPFAPPHVKGVINLRGTVLPVIDLSIRLGMQPIASDPRNVIIVVQVDGVSAGLLVDAVSDILAVSATAFQAAPDMGDDPSSSYLSGLTLIDDQLVRVLNLHAVMPGRPSRAA